MQVLRQKGKAKRRRRIEREEWLQKEEEEEEEVQSRQASRTHFSTTNSKCRAKLAISKPHMQQLQAID